VEKQRVLAADMLDVGWSKSKQRSLDVDLKWTYSNRLDLADLLRRARLWLSEDREVAVKDPQPSVRARLTSGMPRRVVDRLGEDVVQEIAGARQAGMKLKDVAKRYGISESSVKRLSTAAVRDSSKYSESSTWRK
jgi:hypothetical protein